ncbi:MAG: hypothetical protein JJU31_07315 [Wenzhouxiangella sp.]|nr:hypothetical protein [Wenzhouxiangella sp.]MCH8478577.1 hypothetical protein [Wenzhouxiangella sp.]TVR95683.1 MAG: hypothetical protein EA418_07215 [Wenzhouxiangellaceae bacterium]
MPLVFQRLVPGLVLLTMACCLLVACSDPLSDEAQIRQRLDSMVDGLAERNARAVMAPLAEDFSADTWNLDPRGARLLLEREMRAHERLRARVHDFSVELHGQDRATAEFRIILTGGSGLIPERGRWYRVNTGWRRDGSDWMMISASWEDVVGL